MWVKACVHTYNGRGRAAFWESSNENEIDIVNPFKFRIWVAIETLLSKSFNYSIGHRQIWIQLIINVFPRMYAANGCFGWLWVCRDLYFVIYRSPMRTLSVGQYNLRIRSLVLTMIITCFIPCFKAASPHDSQYLADADVSPSIAVEP